MEHLVRLALHGSTLPILVEEDEEDVFELVSNNRVPLFWMTLLEDRDLTGD